MTSYKLLNQSGLESLKKAESKAIFETEIQINCINECISNYESVIERLGNLSKNPCHEVKVHLGKFAFMPGHLVETDRITINLGGKWFIETSPNHALEIIGRRVKALKEKREKFEKQKELMTTRLDFTDQFGQEGQKCVEIVEEFDEEAEKAWREKHKKNVLRERRKELEEKEKSEHITVEELFKKFNYKDDDDYRTTETAERIERPRLPVGNEMEVAAAVRAVAAAESISSAIVEEENEEEDDDEDIKADFKEYLKSIGISVSDVVCSGSSDNPSCVVAGTDNDPDDDDDEDYKVKVQELLEPEALLLNNADKKVDHNICDGGSCEVTGGIERNGDINTAEQSHDQSSKVDLESVHLHTNVNTSEYSIKDCGDEIDDVRGSDNNMVATNEKAIKNNSGDGNDPGNKQLMNQCRVHVMDTSCNITDDNNDLVTISVVMPKSSDTHVDSSDVYNDDRHAVTKEEDWKEFINCIGTSKDQNNKKSLKSRVCAAGDATGKGNGDSDECRAQSYMETGGEVANYWKEKNGDVGNYGKFLKETWVPSSNLHDLNDVEKLEKTEDSHPISSAEVPTKRRVCWKDLEDQNTQSSSSDQSEEYDDDDDCSSSCSDDNKRCARTIVVNFRHSSVQPVISSIIPPTNSEVSSISMPGDIYRLYKSRPKSILKTRRSDQEVPKITITKNESEIRQSKKSENSPRRVTVSQPSPAASQPKLASKSVVSSNVIEKTQKDITTPVGAKDTGHRVSKFKAMQMTRNQQ